MIVAWGPDSTAASWAYEAIGGAAGVTIPGRYTPRTRLARVDNLRSEFIVDVLRMGRWLIYGTRDESMAVRRRELLGEEVPYLDPSDESFGLGYAVELSLRVGRESGAFTSTGAPFADRPEPLGGISIIGSKYYLPVSDDGWRPGEGDLIFAVEWDVLHDEVPFHGEIQALHSIYQVATVQPMFGDQGRQAYWVLYGRELEYNRTALTAALARRWPDSSARGWARRYQRS